MQKKSIPTNFLTYIESGSVRISCDDIPSVKFSAAKDTKILDVINIPIKIPKKSGIIKQLSEAKDFAKQLAQKNQTFEVRLEGKTVLKLGEKANPKLAKIITLSNNIEISDLKKLKKLIEAL